MVTTSKKYLLALLSSLSLFPTFSQTLSPLSVNANHVVDANGKTVILRGCVTITQDGQASSVIYTQNDYKRLKSWGANYQSIRIFAANIGATGIPYQLNKFLDTLDVMVSRAKQVGIYTEFKLTMYGTIGFKWDDIWDNTNGEQNQVIKGWKNIWNRYKNEPAVIGYDLLNEPERGNTLTVSDNYFVCNYLNPFYQKIIDSLKIVDNSKIALIQPALGVFAAQVNYMDYTCPIARTNVVYAPHFYIKLNYADTLGYAVRIQKLKNEAALHNSPLFIGEYGVPWNSNYDNNTTEKIKYVKTEIVALAFFDSLKIGFSRPWFADDNAQVTQTINWALISGTSGLAGPERKFIMDVISRPYPQTTAGTLLSTKYNVISKRSVIKYIPNTALGVTTIFIPRQRHYYSDSMVVYYNKLVRCLVPGSNVWVTLANPDNINTANFSWNIAAEILSITEWQSDTAAVIITNTFPKVVTSLQNNSDKRSVTFNIYPNPSDGKFTIEWDALASLSTCLGQGTRGELEIYNVYGEKVAPSISPKGGGFYSLPSGGQGWALDLSSQPAGVYFIRAKTEKEIATQKLIIQK